MNDLFSNTNIVKYLIVFGLFYSILKIIPSQKINDRDVILIMLIIIVGYVLIDCLCYYNKTKNTTENNTKNSVNNKNMEKFSASIAIEDANKDLEILKEEEEKIGFNIDFDFVNKSSTDINTEYNKWIELNDNLNNQMVQLKILKENYTTDTDISEISTAILELRIKKIKIKKFKLQYDNLENKQDNSKETEFKEQISCDFKVLQVQRQLETEINKLKVQLEVKSNQPSPNNEIVNRYLESLITELVEKRLLEQSDVENIRIKMRSKLLNTSEIIDSLEIIKKEGKPKINGVSVKNNNNDNMYNELPPEYYSPIGDKTNEWNDEYTLLNTNKWNVPMPRPPVCINTTPCKVCPTASSDYPVNLKEWDDSRTITSTKINKDWVNNQHE